MSAFAGIVAPDLALARRLYGDIRRSWGGQGITLSFHPDLAGVDEYGEEWQGENWTEVELTEQEARELHADLGELLGGRLGS